MKILAYFFAAIMLLSGVMHIVNPDVYLPMIPNFINPKLANGLAFITEIAVGIMLLMPKYRHYGGLGFALLMIAFLPIHIWDLMKDNPMMGSKMAATVRLIVQFVLIYLGYRIYHKFKN